MSLHPKIKELKLRAAPITYSNVIVDTKGKMTTAADLLDQRIVQGYLVVWGVVDDYGTKFIKGSFSRSINNRGPKSSSKYKIAFLWQHDQRDPLSLFDELEEDDYGLRFKTFPLDDVPNADRTIKQIRSGTLNQFSIGFDYIWDKMEYDDSDDSLVIMECELYEGSVVTIGANMETYALRSPEQLQDDMEDLHDETENFIKTIPRKQQLELRQLIARHKTLSKIDPLELRQKALDESDPSEAVIDYNYLSQNFKLT